MLSLHICKLYLNWIEQLGIENITPLHPETELTKRGAHFFASHGVLTDLDQSKVEVDGRLVTGQNQNSACEAAQRIALSLTSHSVRARNLPRIYISLLYYSNLITKFRQLQRDKHRGN